MMKITQETAVEVCGKIFNILSLPFDQYCLKSNSKDGYGLFTISEGTEETEMEFFVESFLDPSLVLVRVLFYPSYIGLD